MFRDLVGRTVLVNTSTGDAFRGQVVESNRSFVRLSGVDVIEATGRAGSADGFVRLPVALVTWVQEL